MSHDTKDIWVGSLHPQTTETEFVSAFQTFGIVEKYFFKAGRRFAFVTYVDAASVENAVAMSEKVFIHGNVVQVKRTTPQGTPKERATAGPSLYVGNLAPTATEALLKAAFSSAGTIKKIFLYADRGFGFIEYDSEEFVQRALQMSPPTIAGQVVSISEAVRKDKSSERPGKDAANERRTLHLTNIPATESNEVVEQAIRQAVPDAAAISACAVKVPMYAFVTFNSFESAEKAMGSLRRTVVGTPPYHRVLRATFARNNDEKLNAGPEQTKEEKRRRTMFLTNLPHTVTEDLVRAKYENYGDVRTCNVPPDKQDPSRAKGFAFVEFLSEDQALEAIRITNGSTWLNQRLLCQIAKPPKDARGVPQYGNDNAPSQYGRSQSSPSRAPAQNSYGRSTYGAPPSRYGQTPAPTHAPPPPRNSYDYSPQNSYSSSGHGAPAGNGQARSYGDSYSAEGQSGYGRAPAPRSSAQSYPYQAQSSRY